MQTPKTRRGKERRDALVEAAAQLMYRRGVRATSLEEILDAAGAGKSQLYHYFSSKDDLTAAVLDYQLTEVLGEQKQFPLETWAGIRSWFEALRAGQEARGFNGCPVGSLAIEMSAMGNELQGHVADAFLRWHTSLEEAFEDMRARGLLRENAVPAELAEATLAAIQGGYLLSTVKRDIGPMARSLELAFVHLRSWSSIGDPDQPSTTLVKRSSKASLTASRSAPQSRRR